MKIKNQVIRKSLEILEPFISELVTKSIQRYEEKTSRKAKGWMWEFVRFELTHDLCKALEKYTLSTDTLVEMNHASQGAGGGITIMARIKRAGMEYWLTTDIIYAGGYNIQSLHLRYITKSNLPRITADTPATLALKAILKAHKSFQRIEEDQNRIILQINRAQASKSQGDSMSDDQIAQELMENDDHVRNMVSVSWDDISEYGKSQNPTPEHWDAYLAEMIMEKVESKRTQFQRNGDAVIRMGKELKKVNEKLKASLKELKALQK